MIQLGALRLVALPIVALVGVCLLGGCPGPSGNDKFESIAPPFDPDPQSGFPLVGNVFGSHCGSLDCHGQVGRNMRIYSGNGLRLPNSEGNVSGGSTTSYEYLASYQSIISIDPEVLSDVVRAGGAGAGKWIVLSKGRGTEAHKGHTALIPFSDADFCVVAWVSGAALDPQMCGRAAELLPPDGGTP
jgi:hypothetical protein